MNGHQDREERLAMHLEALEKFEWYAMADEPTRAYFRQRWPEYVDFFLEVGVEGAERFLHQAKVSV